MASRLMDKKFTLMLLGFLTAITLAAALVGGVNLSTPYSTVNATGNLFIILYISIPVLLLILGIFRLRMSKDRRYFIYTISILASAVIIIPLLFIAFIVVLVGLFGLMPTRLLIQQHEIEM